MYTILLHKLLWKGKTLPISTRVNKFNKFSLEMAHVLVYFALLLMQNYLSDVWKLSFTHAAGIMNIWGGIYRILPHFFLISVDALLGNFLMLVLSSISYTLGISFITMSTPPVLANSTGTCKEYEPNCIGHTQRVLFYTGMALVAVGMSGNSISVKPFLDEQYDIRTRPILAVTLTLGVFVPIVGNFALPYINSWSLRFGIPAICMAFATLLFFTGSCAYNKETPKGSPFISVCRVIVAFAFNICKPYPLDANHLYRREGDEDQTFKCIRFLRCLKKAAILTNPDDPDITKWKLCTVTEVEEAKFVVCMVPIWMNIIICGIVSSIGNTYFLEQANNMNRKIGKLNVPLPILVLLYKGADDLIKFCAYRYLSTPNKVVALRGIAMAMVFSILCCITAAIMETRRLNVIRSHDLLDKPDKDIPMSIYWLAFQFFLLIVLDSFFEQSVVAFYKDQAPDSMKNILEKLTTAVTGLGYMCSVLSVYVVGKISEMGGRPNWFQFTLNRSRLDRYYWVLAGLSSVNLVVYILVAPFYRYKKPEASDAVEDDRETNELTNDIVQASCS
ncbi:hypothetical protein ACJIZ3_024010 [Penstemon smallii]|uniref:Uncharacterized protein n=1 Tax=Penstemon smallii TaxID=265156 RepID=A0ABD3TQM2_9LAMI